MSLEPLFHAGPGVVTHAAAAISATVVGAAQFVGRKGTRMHKRLG